MTIAADVGLSRVVADLFPAPVVVATRQPEQASTADLLDSERTLLTPRMSARRVQHLSMGRAAAHDALCELRGAACAVGRGPGGQPTWPDGVVGSISHTDALGVAVVGRSDAYRGLGVDVEDADRTIAEPTLRLVCSASERVWVTGGDAADGSLSRERRFVLLFAAKEALFKALYPLENTWLGFSAVECVWQADQPGFQATLTTPAASDVPAGTRLQVRCALAGTLAVAAVGLVQPQTTQAR